MDSVSSSDSKGSVSSSAPWVCCMCLMCLMNLMSLVSSNETVSIVSDTAPVADPSGTSLRHNGRSAFSWNETTHSSSVLADRCRLGTPSRVISLASCPVGLLILVSGAGRLAIANCVLSRSANRCRVVEPTHFKCKSHLGTPPTRAGRGVVLGSWLDPRKRAIGAEIGQVASCSLEVFEHRTDEPMQF